MFKKTERDDRNKKNLSLILLFKACLAASFATVQAREAIRSKHERFGLLPPAGFACQMQ